MELVKLKLKDIHPYPNNPRKNDQAVNAVVESIRQCSYIAPIIVDENHVILAGHTRYKALKKCGWTEAEVIIREGLSEEQKKKYRLLDNKTNEFAEWDLDALEQELEGLDFCGFDFGFDDSEFTDEELEKLMTNEVMARAKKVHRVTVDLQSEHETVLVYELLKANGYNPTVTNK